MKKLFIEIFQPIPFACGTWLIVDGIKKYSESLGYGQFFSLYFGFAMILSGIGLFLANTKEQNNRQ